MDNYIANLILKLGHPDHKKLLNLPYKHITIQYGSKVQYANETLNQPHLKLWSSFMSDL